MATEKVSKTVERRVESETKGFNFFGKLYKFNLILLTLGLLIWVFVGSFFALNIVEQLKFMVGQKAVQKLNEPEADLTTKVVTLPGIGQVDLDCIKRDVKEEILQKIIAESGTSTLNAEDKQKVESCIVSQATPSATPVPTPTG